MVAVTPQRPRILIVEDEWILAETLATDLADLGYDVVGPAYCVNTAFTLMEQEKFSAAVLDVSLGFGQKSFPVALALAERGIPFLFMTGYQTSDLPHEFAQKIVIGKPVLLGVLGARLVELLSNSTVIVRRKDCDA